MSLRALITPKEAHAFELVFYHKLVKSQMRIASVAFIVIVTSRLQAIGIPNSVLLSSIYTTSSTSRLAARPKHHGPHDR